MCRDNFSGRDLVAPLLPFALPIREGSGHKNSQQLDCTPIKVLLRLDVWVLLESIAPVGMNTGSLSLGANDMDRAG